MAPATEPFLSRVLSATQVSVQNPRANLGDPSSSDDWVGHGFSHAEKAPTSTDAPMRRNYASTGSSLTQVSARNRGANLGHPANGRAVRGHRTSRRSCETWDYDLPLSRLPHPSRFSKGGNQTTKRQGQPHGRGAPFFAFFANSGNVPFPGAERSPAACFGGPGSRPPVGT
jgi:hypothetical protein